MAYIPGLGRLAGDEMKLWLCPHCNGITKFQEHICPIAGKTHLDKEYRWSVSDDFDVPVLRVAQIDNSDSAIRLTVPSLETKIAELCAAIDRLVNALESKP